MFLLLTSYKLLRDQVHSITRRGDQHHITQSIHGTQVIKRDRFEEVLNWVIIKRAIRPYKNISTEQKKQTENDKVGICVTVNPSN